MSEKASSGRRETVDGTSKNISAGPKSSVSLNIGSSSGGSSDGGSDGSESRRSKKISAGQKSSVKVSIVSARDPNSAALIPLINWTRLCN